MTTTAKAQFYDAQLLQAFDRYDTYLEKKLTVRRFKHKDIIPIIYSLKSNLVFEIQPVGQSVEGREINLIKIGHGETKILLWSQMHGDESTATMSLFDLCNFFSRHDDLDPLRVVLLDQVSIFIVPMLNPDGAELNRRRNALDIDLNRDAVRLISPESQILKHLCDSIKPQFGFNLHDQGKYYTCDTSSKPATISFLAPAYNYEKDINEVRANAMKLIVTMNTMLQAIVPGQVAKYSDDFEPRAFGDNIQKWGVSTILIESGEQPNDPERQYVRKLNYLMLLNAIYSIANKTYTTSSLADYEAIPGNARYMFDLIIRNALMEKNGKKYLVDVGVNHTEIDVDDHSKFYELGQISELGDMSVFHAYQEFDAQKMLISPGKVYSQTLKKASDLQKLNTNQLLSQGITTICVEEQLSREITQKFPLHIINSTRKSADKFGMGAPAHFVLQKNGIVQFAVINGFIYDIQKQEWFK